MVFQVQLHPKPIGKRSEVRGNSLTGNICQLFGFEHFRNAIRWISNPSKYFPFLSIPSKLLRATIFGTLFYVHLGNFVLHSCQAVPLPYAHNSQ